MPKEATHLIKIWFYISSKESPEVIRGRMLERFEYLGDALENIEIIPLEEKGGGV